MTCEHALEIVADALAPAREDSDTYLYVHFSREEDAYQAIQHRMDAGDAMVVIRNLIEAFGIDPALLTHAIAD